MMILIWTSCFPIPYPLVSLLQHRPDHANHVNIPVEVIGLDETVVIANLRDVSKMNVIDLVSVRSDNRVNVVRADGGKASDA